MPALQEPKITWFSEYEASLKDKGLKLHMLHVAARILKEGVETTATQDCPIVPGSVFVSLLEETGLGIKARKFLTEELVLDEVLSPPDREVATVVRTGIILPGDSRPLRLTGEGPLHEALAAGQLQTVMEDVRIPSSISRGAQSLVSVLVAA